MIIRSSEGSVERRQELAGASLGSGFLRCVHPNLRGFRGFVFVFALRVVTVFCMVFRKKVFVAIRRYVRPHAATQLLACGEFWLWHMLPDQASQLCQKLRQSLRRAFALRRMQ